MEMVRKNPTIYLREDDLEFLKEMAKRDNISLSQEINVILQVYIDRERNAFKVTPIFRKNGKEV